MSVLCKLLELLLSCSPTGLKRCSHGEDETECCVTPTQKMEPVSREKLQVGEDLFHKVAEIETELCAQITGAFNNNVCR